MSTLLKPKTMSASDDDGGVLTVRIQSSATTLLKPKASSVATTASKRCVKSVVVKEGGIDCCGVCGLVFEDMPDKSKCCYRHKRLVQSMVKRWSPKRIKGGSNNCFHANLFARE